MLNFFKPAKTVASLTADLSRLVADLATVEQENDAAAGRVEAEIAEKTKVRDAHLAEMTRAAKVRANLAALLEA